MKYTGLIIALSAISIACAILASPAMLFTECGMCGAHVIEWWKVPTIDGEGFCDVCRYCYEAIIE